MDNNAFSFYSNAFGVLLGFCRSHLPSQRIKEREGLLGETQSLYESAVEMAFYLMNRLEAKWETR